MISREVKIKDTFSKNSNIVLYPGNCLELLRQIPDNAIQLIVTSPPYNIGKSYESVIRLNEYLALQRNVIQECYRVLRNDGHICWQVGNYVENGMIAPLDILLYPIFQDIGMQMRNRIIWHFNHGLHCSKRFSGRYETIMWFTKTDEYKFNLDPVRIPQKYPEKKYFKGPKKGQLSCNPLGKNPGDVWDIPNVKCNHPEKTIHPCQFPVELVERLVLSMTDKDDWILDPFAGVGSSLIASMMHGRKCAGAELNQEYIDIARNRLLLASRGILKTRPMNKPIYSKDIEKINIKELLLLDKNRSNLKKGRLYAKSI